MTEQDQAKKLSLEFRIIEFLGNKESIKDSELSKYFTEFHYNFKVIKQKKEISHEEFESFLIKCRLKIT